MLPQFQGGWGNYFYFIFFTPYTVNSQSFTFIVHSLGYTYNCDPEIIYCLIFLFVVLCSDWEKPRPRFQHLRGNQWAGEPLQTLRHGKAFFPSARLREHDLLNGNHFLYTIHALYPVRKELTQRLSFSKEDKILLKGFHGNMSYCSAQCCTSAGYVIC